MHLSPKEVTELREQSELFSLTILLKDYWGRPIRKIQSGNDLESFMCNKMDSIIKEHNDIDGGWEDLFGTVNIVSDNKEEN